MWNRLKAFNVYWEWKFDCIMLVFVPIHDIFVDGAELLKKHQIDNLSSYLSGTPEACVWYLLVKSFIAKFKVVLVCFARSQAHKWHLLQI